MAAGDVTLTRGISFRDDFLDVAAWTLDAGVTLTTDGDIATLSGTTGANGATRSVPGSVATTTYPKIIIRQKSSVATTFPLLVTFTDATNQTLNLTGTTTYVTDVFTLTAGKTLSSLKFYGQAVSQVSNIDFVFVFKETLTLPAVSQPLQFALPRYLVELPIPTREGGVLQDLGSQSAQLEISGTLISTTSPNNYTGEQWWDVLVGTWLEGNWQWLTSDRVTYKYQIQEFTAKQDPGRVGYYDFKLRLKKLDVLNAIAQTFGAIQ